MRRGRRTGVLLFDERLDLQLCRFCSYQAFFQQQLAEESGAYDPDVAGDRGDRQQGEEQDRRCEQGKRAGFLGLRHPDGKIIVEFPVFKGDIKAYLDKGKTETPKKMF